MNRVVLDRFLLREGARGALAQESELALDHDAHRFVKSRELSVVDLIGSPEWREARFIEDRVGIDEEALELSRLGARGGREALERQLAAKGVRAETPQLLDGVEILRED